MSMHNQTLTDIERQGLQAHGLPIDLPSQLSDAFRHGMAWAEQHSTQDQAPAVDPEQHGAQDTAITGIDPEKLLALAKRRQHDSGVTLGFPTVLKIVETLRMRTAAQPGYCLIDHLIRQIAFSMHAFGPGERQQGVVDHIRKELTEIEEDPNDLEEWIDVVLLALDGAWRAGFTAAEVAIALESKLAKNESRTWPDWRTADRTKAIEHERQAGEGSQ